MRWVGPPGWQTPNQLNVLSNRVELQIAIPLDNRCRSSLYADNDLDERATRKKMGFVPQRCGVLAKTTEVPTMVRVE